MTCASFYFLFRFNKYKYIEILKFTFYSMEGFRDIHNRNIESARGSLDSRRGFGHLSRILILFTIMLLLSILLITFFVSKRKNDTQTDIPIKHDLFTPPTMLS